jgi:hypothetical protein
MYEYRIGRNSNQQVARAQAPSLRVRLPAKPLNLGISESRILGFWDFGLLEREDLNLILITILSPRFSWIESTRNIVIYVL